MSAPDHLPVIENHNCMVFVRCKPTQKESMERAAALSGKRLSTWMRDTLVRVAEDRLGIERLRSGEVR